MVKMDDDEIVSLFGEPYISPYKEVRELVDTLLPLDEGYASKWLHSVEWTIEGKFVLGVNANMIYDNGHGLVKVGEGSTLTIEDPMFVFQAYRNKLKDDLEPYECVSVFMNWGARKYAYASCTTRENSKLYFTAMTPTDGGKNCIKTFNGLVRSRITE